MPHDIYKIVWQKWIDPFGQDHEESAYLDYDNENPDMASIQSSSNKEDQSIEEDNEDLIKKRSIKVIASPMGLIPYNEHTASGKIFNFWLGHTNFDITAQVSKIIEDTDGVEALDIFTRYRFRIAVGKCFGSSETMVRIQENICRYLDEQELDKLS
jgi:hypothetical protein